VASYQIQHSLAGRIGRWLEPVVEPLGFDWRIAVGIVASLAAREVIIATLGQIYAVETESEDVSMLAEILPRELHPPNVVEARSGHRLAVALSLLVFFVFALQCVSTLAVMGRETGSRKWPALAFISMFAIAYGASFLTYRITLWLAL
jgi:ferrous iron transport protein B